MRRNIVQDLSTLSPSSNLASLGRGFNSKLPGVIRLAVGLIWLTSVDWKVPPDFGRAARSGLWRLLTQGVDHPVFAPYSWLIEHVLRPNIGVFGWVVIAVEVGLAILLLSGTFTKAAAFIGIGQATLIMLAGMKAPGQWYWTYPMLIVLHLAVIALDAGGVWGIDGIRRRHRVDPVSAERSMRTGRIALTTLLGTLGFLTVMFQADQPLLTPLYPESGVGFISGTVGLGIVFIGAAASVWWLADKPEGGTAGYLMLAFALVAVLTYQTPLNVFSATPSAAVILAIAAIFLLVVPTDRNQAEV